MFVVVLLHGVLRPQMLTFVLYIAHSKRVAEDTIWQLAFEMFSALDYCHKQGVAHHPSRPEAREQYARIWFVAALFMKPKCEEGG